ncbi:hypothetical protein V8F33_004550 [Rhypophila sp. PSN 637]
MSSQTLSSTQAEHEASTLPRERLSLVVYTATFRTIRPFPNLPLCLPGRSSQGRGSLCVPVDRIWDQNRNGRAASRLTQPIRRLVNGRDPAVISFLLTDHCKAGVREGSHSGFGRRLLFYMCRCHPLGTGGATPLGQWSCFDSPRFSLYFNVYTIPILNPRFGSHCRQQDRSMLICGTDAVIWRMTSIQNLSSHLLHLPPFSRWPLLSSLLLSFLPFQSPASHLPSRMTYPLLISSHFVGLQPLTLLLSLFSLPAWVQELRSSHEPARIKPLSHCCCCCCR